MKYPQIAAAVGWTETPDAQEGLFLQPEEATKIEETFSAHATALQTAKTELQSAAENAAREIASINEKVTALSTDVATANTNLEAANTELSTTKNALATANAEVERLKDLSGNPSGTSTDQDKFENKVSAADYDFQKELLSQV